MSSDRGSATKSQSVLDTVAHFIPMGHEKALKQALYTTGSITILVLFFVVVANAYFVLKLFIKPLLWSLLCGSFLFPFKFALHKFLERCLTDSLELDVPLFIEVSLLPLRLFSKLSDYVGSFVIKKYFSIISFIILFVCLYVLQTLNLVSTIFLLFVNTINYLLSFQFLCWQHLPNLLCFFACLCLIPAIILRQEVFMHIGITFLWFALLNFCFYANLGLGIPVASIFLLLFVIGLVRTDVNLINKPQSSVGASNKYFNILFWLFALVVFIENVSLMIFLCIPLLFFLLKKCVLHQFTWSIIDLFLQKFFAIHLIDLKSKIVSTSSKVEHILFPLPIKCLWNIIKKGDRKIHKLILSRLPMITTVIIILLIFSQTIICLFFLAVRIQHESVFAVQIASNIVNETVQKHPELSRWLPSESFMQKSMGSIVDTVYTQGREWISIKLKTLLLDHPNVNKIENQTIMLWDNLYEEWFSSVQGVDFSHRKYFSFNKLQDLRKKQDLAFNIIDSFSIHEILAWLQENLSSLISYAESLWSLTQSNLNLMMSIVTTILTALLQGGTFVLNFIVSLFIFFTTLFYLLSTSVDQYKPIEVLGKLTRPMTTSGMVFENAVQEAVKGVFGASLKMFCFYGIYTFVNHLLFGAHIVFIPSVLAALFAAVPIIATYWVCIPSALELWLYNGSLFKAVGLVICQLVPTFFVDSAIYQDIGRGGHPYISGLAVAGGLYTYGLEGAIFGPLILCILLVVTNLYSSLF